MEMMADDRIVVRFYIIPIGTMGGARTCTTNYDWSGSTGNAYLSLLETPGVKLESDPPEVWTVPDGMSTLGLAN
jgi:hypothetical protein